MIAFRSGMSTSKDFWGAAAAGADIGVVAGELTSSMVFLAVPRFLKSGGNLFIDSGAFAEFKTGECPDFDQVLCVYEALADPDFGTYSLGQLYVVAPDKVGDQLETLARLAQYGDRVRSLINAGCNMIVPIQRGSMPAVEMVEKVVEILETRDFVLGIPSNKEALSIEECATLRHDRFHVLGRVQQSPEQAARLDALTRHNPNSVVTADASWLRGKISEVCRLTHQIRLGRAVGSEDGERLVLPARTAAITAAIRADAAWGISI